MRPETTLRTVSSRDLPSAIAYAAPMVTFGILTALEAYAPGGSYPLVYALKIATVTAALLWFRGPHRDIRPTWRFVPVAIAAGLAVFAAWVSIDGVLAYPHLGRRIGFDPFTAIGSSSARAAFLSVRFFGLVVVVPVMEELFWRSFLLRYLTRHDYQSLPLWDFSTRAFWMMVIVSAATHPEWLVAAIASAVFALILRRTRSLFAAIVTHASANAVLGVYILVTRQWQYW